MESWEFGVDVEEDDGLNYFADLIFPLYRDPNGERVVFFEPRMQFGDESWLFNNGIGVRQLVQDGQWALGANMFHDYDTGHAHYRLGWGVEALSSYAEMRANYYLGLSQERLIDEPAANSVRTFEEAVDGFDLEIGAPVPHYSRLKIFGGYNWYNFKKFKNRYGWTLRAEYTPVPYVVVDGILANDTKTNLDWKMMVALRIPFGGAGEETGSALTDFESPFVLDEAMFPESDATEHLFALVERNHEIVVEVERDVGGVSVEITRAN